RRRHLERLRELDELGKRDEVLQGGSEGAKCGSASRDLQQRQVAQVATDTPRRSARGSFGSPSAFQFQTLTSRYSVSRCTGILPIDLIRWTSSSVDVRGVVPAAETTFSSIMTEPMSSAPKPSATWPIFIPCVTQDDWMWSTLSR